MSLADTYFKNEVNQILTTGFNDEAYEVRPKWPDGVPTHTIKTFCAVRRYDLSKEFPILTLRTQMFKGVVRELLWMWQKKSNIVDELGKSASIWRAWEDENGTIGKTYGYQLGKVSDYGYGEFDQVDNLIYLLKNKPMDRRMITTMWCPQDLHEMNLPPCVYETLWDVKDGKLNCLVIQRSGDLLAAAASGGWDTMQYAILTHMLAQVCGYEVGELVHIVNNLHIYDRHIDAVKEVMNNPEYPAPKLWINPEVKNFYDFTEDDFALVDYQSTKLTTKFEVAE
ncbi:MAG: thymidylate synthase [Bacteroidales bacterium]|nr:thymidylate synthase [Bacteroidales bacterium]